MSESALSIATVPRLEPWLGREMASAADAELYRSFTRISGTFQEEPHPSRILAVRSDLKHRLGELYEHMLETDSDLAGFARKRVSAVTSLPRFIVPTNSTPDAIEVADFVRSALAEVKSFDVNVEHQLGGIARGSAFDEIVWERRTRGPLAGAWIPADIIDRPMWRFAFQRGERGSIYVRRPGLAAPLLAPERKFVVHRFGTKDSQWGDPLLDEAYWYWFIKKHAWKYWCVFTEKWAAPTAMGEYKHGPDDATNRDNQTKLLGALNSIQQEQGIVIPTGLVVRFLEAQRSGSVSYESFVDACTRGEARVFFGEVDTSGAGAGPGSFAKAAVSNDSRLEAMRSDAHGIESHLSDTLIAWLVDLNFGADAPRPKLWIAAVDAEDRDLRLRGIDAVLEKGEPVPRRYLYLTARVPVPEEGDEVVEGAQSLFGPALSGPGATIESGESGGAALTPPAPPSPVNNAPVAGTVDVQDTALNGAQITSLVEIILRVASGELPAESAKAACLAAFPSLDDEEVNRLIDPAAAAASNRPEPAPEAPSPVQQTAAASSRTLQRLAAKNVGDLGARIERQAQDLDTIAAAFLPQTTEYYSGHRASVLRLWDGGEFRSGRGFRALVAGSKALEHAKTLETAQLHGMGWSLAHLRDEVGIEALRLAAPGAFQRARTPETAVDFWSTLLRIPKEIFELLADDNRRLAFTVAGVTDAALLADIHALIERAIAGGMGRDEFVTELDALYASQGLTPTSRHHAELIYTNNVRQAASVMRWRQTTGNQRAHALIPYLVFWTLGDDRVRARPGHNHRAMHGYIAAVDHPIWKTWTTPAGHGCRCGIGTINRAEARRRGLTGSEPVGPWPLADGVRAMPDPGFRGVPDLARVAADEDDRGAEMLDEARTLGSPDLVAALEQLFRALGITSGGGGGNFAAILSAHPAAA